MEPLTNKRMFGNSVQQINWGSVYAFLPIHTNTSNYTVQCLFSPPISQIAFFSTVIQRETGDVNVPFDYRKILGCILLPGFQCEKDGWRDSPSLRLTSNATSPIKLSLTALTRTSSHFRPLTSFGKPAPSSQLSLGLYPHIPKMAVRPLWVGITGCWSSPIISPWEKNIIRAALN